MASKTHQRRVRAANRRIAARMIAEGLDPAKPADRTEYTKRVCDRILKSAAQRNLERVGGLRT